MRLKILVIARIEQIQLTARSRSYVQTSTGLPDLLAEALGRPGMPPNPISTPNSSHTNPFHSSVTKTRLSMAVLALRSRDHHWSLA